MDATTEFLSDYAHRLGYADLSPEAVHQVKRTLVDTLGCAAGAFDCELVAIVLRVVSRVQGDFFLVSWAHRRRRPRTLRRSRTPCSSDIWTVTTPTQPEGRATQVT